MPICTVAKPFRLIAQRLDRVRRGPRRYAPERRGRSDGDLGPGNNRSRAVRHDISSVVPGSHRADDSTARAYLAPGLLGSLHARPALDHLIGEWR
jgi:hypothetical protein